MTRSLEKHSMENVAVECGAAAIPYSDAPSHGALYSTAIEAGEDFWVESKLLYFLTAGNRVTGVKTLDTEKLDVDSQVH